MLVSQPLQRKRGKIREQGTASYPMHSKERGREGEVLLLVSEHCLIYENEIAFTVLLPKI